MTMTKESLREVLDEWGEWLLGERLDYSAFINAARFVERLLPEKCEHGETAPHDFDNQWQGVSECDGQLWDEGLVEVVARATFTAWFQDDPGDWSLDKEHHKEFTRIARAVLAALTAEVGK